MARGLQNTRRDSGKRQKADDEAEGLDPPPLTDALVRVQVFGCCLMAIRVYYRGDLKSHLSNQETWGNICGFADREARSLHAIDIQGHA